MNIEDEDDMLCDFEIEEVIVRQQVSHVNKKKYLIYPESAFIGSWDLFMVFILIITCVLTPLRLAFVSETEEESMVVLLISYIIDGLFLIDIFVIFSTAYYDEYFQVIDDRAVIAKRYLRGWFLIDVLAIVPFDLILRGGNGSGEFNSMVRFARLGRLYKLIKLTRLIRVFKIMKDKGKFMKIITDLLKVGPGFERLFFFAVVSLIACHIFSCLWIMLP